LQKQFSSLLVAIAFKILYIYLQVKNTCNGKNNKYFQFWQQGFHPIELYGYETLKQKLNYLHKNPIRAGIIYESWHYKYSSAIDYCTTMKGKIDLELFKFYRTQSWVFYYV